MNRIAVGVCGVVWLFGILVVLALAFPLGLLCGVVQRIRRVGG